MLDITPDLESEPRDKLDKLFPLLLLAMKANEVNPEA